MGVPKPRSTVETLEPHFSAVRNRFVEQMAGVVQVAVAAAFSAR